MSAPDKTMFEIYREADYNRAFRFVFYTDLEEHARDDEIARAASGDAILSGFVNDAVKDAARAEITRLVDELNERDDPEFALVAATLRERLSPFLVDAESTT